MQKVQKTYTQEFKSQDSAARPGKEVLIWMDSSLRTRYT